MPDRPEPTRRLHALLAFGGIAVAVLALPPTEWRVGASLAHMQISIGIDMGSVRLWAALSDCGQSVSGAAQRVAGTPA